MKKKNILGMLVMLATVAAIAGIAAAQLSSTTPGQLANVTLEEKVTVSRLWGQVTAMPLWSVSRQNWYYNIRAENGTQITWGKFEGLNSTTIQQKTLDAMLDTVTSQWMKQEAARISLLAYYDSVRPSMNGRVY
jgi:hypothetical protein